LALYLVTGGAGFIGSNLVRRLLSEGQSIRVVDDFSTGKRENLDDVKGEIELVEGSICDEGLARRALEGVEFVLHQAAIPSVPRSLQDPLATHHSAVTGTLNLLIAAKDASVRRFVYAGSSSAYGDTAVLPKVETMPPEPISPYAAAKLAGEYYCRVFWKVHRVPTVILRYFNVFGPRQDPESLYSAVIPRFIGALLSGKPPTIYGDGTQTRDFTYIDDVVDANLLAITSERSPGKVINIAGGREISINDLASTLSSLIGAGIEPVYGPPRPGDVLRSVADISRARELLGFAPAVSFEEGLRRTVEWFKAARPS